MTLVEFADLQCPFCKQYSTDVMPALVADYVKSGKLKMVFRNVAFIGTDSARAAQMAAAAGRQNKLWEYIDIFYVNQGAENSGYVTDEFLRDVGDGVEGLDVDKAMDDRGVASVQDELNKAQTEWQANGFTGTPSFLVGPHRLDAAARWRSRPSTPGRVRTSRIDRELAEGLLADERPRQPESAAREPVAAAPALAARRRPRARGGGRRGDCALVGATIPAAKPKLRAGESLPGQVEANARFAGIPQDGITLGDPDAPVTLVGVRGPAVPVLPPVLDRRHADPGRRLRQHREAEDGLPQPRVHWRGLGARCADGGGGRPAGQAVGVHRRLLRQSRRRESGYVTDEFLRKVGGAVEGLDVDQAMGDRGLAAVTQQLEDADAAAAVERRQGNAFLPDRADRRQLTRFPSDADPTVAALSAAHRRGAGQGERMNERPHAAPRLLVLTFVGIGIAGYLTYIHYQGLDPICAVGHGCEKVQNSKYAKVSGRAGPAHRLDRLRRDPRSLLSAASWRGSRRRRWRTADSSSAPTSRTSSCSRSTRSASGASAARS